MLLFLYLRVQEYVRSGRDKNIVDPDPHQVYTRRKLRLEESRAQNNQQQKNDSSIKYPSSGWSTNLQRMPLFTRAEMNLHISQSGKNIDSSSQSHSVPTSLRKAKSFLEDEYFKEIVSASDNQFFYFKCLCHHSFRKKRPTSQAANCSVYINMKHMLHAHVLQERLDFVTMFWGL